MAEADHRVSRPAPIEIRFSNVDLATKLDALGAALASVREAHKDVMQRKCWAALNRAQEQIAEAIMHSSPPPRPRALAPGASPTIALT